MASTKINAAGIGTTETVTVDGLTVINDGSFGGNLTVSGVLTYEDVTNVDSVGLITARNGIVVGSGITLSKDGDVFFTGIATGNGSGLTALNASNLASGTVPTARLGSGTASSSTFLRGDSTFQTVNTDLVSDTSPQLGGDLDTNSHNILLDDDHYVKFGDSSDLTIRHTGGANAIDAAAGQYLYINSDNLRLNTKTGSEKYITGTVNGAVELYHDNSKTFETTTLGATVTRDLTLNHASGDTALRWAVGGTNRFSLYESSNTLRFYDNTNSAERLRITSAGDLLIGNTNGGAEAINLVGGGGGILISRSASDVPTDGQTLGDIGLNSYSASQTCSSADVLIRGQADGAHSGSSAGSALLLFTKPASTGPGSSPTERFRINKSGAFGLAGANYGTSGQVLSSQGSGSAVQWATPSTPITTSVVADISGADAYDFTLPSNCYKVEFVGQNITMSSSGTPAFQVGTTAGMITSGTPYNFTEVSYGGSTAGRFQQSQNEIRFGYYNLNASSDVGDVFATFLSSSAANQWIVNIDSHRRTQTGYLKTMCALNLSGNNLTTIRLYGWSSVNFASGRIRWTGYSY